MAQLPERPKVPKKDQTIIDRWINKIFKAIEAAADRAIERDPHTVSGKAELDRLYKQIAASDKKYRDRYPKRIAKAEKELRDENPFFYNPRYNGERDEKPKKK